MSFWENVGTQTLKIGKKVLKSVDTTIKEVGTYKTKYSKYDDARLKKIIVTGGLAKKMAATAVLKQRDYGKNINR